MKTETLEVNGIKHLVNVYYENRADSKVSIGKSIINIRIPSSLNRDERFRQFLKLKIWARNKLKEHPHKFKPEPQKEYKNGDLLKIGAEEYSISLDFKDKQGSSARIIGNVIQLAVSANLSKEVQNKHISTLLSRCIAGKRLPKLKEKISELNRLFFNQEINKIFFKHHRSRWGSCSRAGNINISTRLLFAPDNVLEYVCVHELAHLIEQNHSEKFWSLVEKAVPDYKERAMWLKENGDRYIF